MQMLVHLVCLMLLALGGTAFANADDATSSKPNVILIVSDDLGWTDLGCYGSDLYPSPRIDGLARDGMRFTANYSACTVCSPTRAAMLTGKYPARLHVTDWIPGLPPANPKLIVPDFVKHLPLEEETIAERLHAAGYATASIGKWHLGGPEYYPEKHGFDVNIAGNDQPQPRPGYFAPYAIDTMKQGPKGEYITDRIGKEAVSFIRENAKRPFFLYMPQFAVHTPIQAKKKLIARNQERVKDGMRHTNAAYAAMVESMDHTVGSIRATLKELGIADHTIIIFTSDNGGRIPTTSNAPLRAGKGSCYEGGVRVPLIVYWPGVTPAGSVCDAPVITMDLYPTILAMTGVADASPSDGVSLVPLLHKTGGLADRSLYWHYPHYQHYQQEGTTPYAAVRRGDWRLVEFYDDHRVELYNLKDDPSERTNVAASSPELVKSLQDELHAWLGAVNAQMPTPNPNYDPTKPEHTPPVTKKQARLANGQSGDA
ncbi:sulfatase [Lacipirellula parvula]|uniref:Arylsulfatase n=1 Tax=Lacipirellula parvula TaxID=2650471 RepID=A0A5K7XGB5_9BACT|nr:sulfatase [Lacipirellula parvula]BBO33326.1 arylsulfatase [Lacipirellula parvula]